MQAFIRVFAFSIKWVCVFPLQKNVEGFFMSVVTKSRNELRLPELYFVAMDQWVEKIGEKAFIAWMKLYSLAKRDEETTGENKWEVARVPFSINKLYKMLGVGKDTFYNKILKPLWNAGLIDLVEYEGSQNKGTKPINIIVYKYPQNNKELATKELVFIRDYDKDYQSETREYAKMGGRPKSNTKKENQKVDTFDRWMFQNQTPPGSETERNNNHNDLNNNFNNNIFNYSSSSKKKKQEEEKVKQLINKNISYQVLVEFLKTNGFEKSTINKTILKLSELNIDMFSLDDVKKQLNYMMEKYANDGEMYHFAAYFAYGLNQRVQLSRAKRAYLHKKEKELEERKIRYEKVKDIYFNWLEEAVI